MAAKKKIKKKSSRLKKKAGKTTAAKRPARKRTTAGKQAKKRATAKRKSPVSATRGSAGRGDEKPRKTRRLVSPAFPRESTASQSGDLQGLSNVESVDSESVDELLEEGNSFEAGIISGVEDSGGRNVKEVRTREVPEDDVPGEYLDEE